VPLRQDDWGVDVVAAGSQKALMCPPGLGFAAPNQAALDRAAEHAGQGRYYFDWHKTLKGQRKDPPDSAFTPAVSIFMALDVALQQILDEGVENVFERHRLLGRAARAAVKGMELEQFGPDDENSNVVTAVKLPENIDGGKVPKIMRDKYGITIAGGQNQLKGKIARIAHTGYFGAFDILTTLAALEMTLSELGHPVELGAGTGAAQGVFLEAGVPAAAPA
jgi:aspartate aminotransferase-like enzyme